MADAPGVQTVETEDEFIHVRFRDPDDFDTIRTPDWAAKAARDVSEGAEVRTGKRKDGDDWEVQSVLVKKSVGEDKAREQAEEIVEKIESWSACWRTSGQSWTDGRGARPVSDPKLKNIASNRQNLTIDSFVRNFIYGLWKHRGVDFQWLTNWRHSTPRS
nr:MULTISPECIES: hypothetical protein [Halorussus]